MDGMVRIPEANGFAKIRKAYIVLKNVVAKRRFFIALILKSILYYFFQQIKHIFPAENLIFQSIAFIFFKVMVLYRYNNRIIPLL